MDHLERLVDDLLDIARVSRDKLELRREHVDLAPIVEQAIEICGPLAEQSGLEIDVEIAPETIWLDADPVRLTQVFANLLNNACKYSNPGGRISITAERDNGAAVIAVRDTGLGIPPHMLSKVFEMFSQVAQDPERTQSGLGIGLTLVRRLVEMHGGSVEAHSRGLGHGSTFVVRLPVSGGAKKIAAAAESPEAGPTPRRRVLVVDDNADAAEALELLLQLDGHETRVAGDGIEALEAAQSFRPDIVILDIGLPRMSGYEVARHLRAEEWGGAIRIIGLTGWGQEEDRRQSNEVGFDHHLVKPVDFATLKTLLAADP
jgi:CheY-like chemotaxis protein